MHWKFLDRTTASTAPRSTALHRGRGQLRWQRDGLRPPHAPSFHLHGAGGSWSCPVRGGRAQLVWKATVLSGTRPGRRHSVSTSPTRPVDGHCHIAEHMQSGMMFSFTSPATGRGPPYRPPGRGAPGPGSESAVGRGGGRGSQAGLAIAWHLARQGLRFVVLEAALSSAHLRSAVGLAELFTPAQYDALPAWRSRPRPTATRPRTRLAANLQTTPRPSTSVAGSTPRSPSSGGWRMELRGLHRDATYQARQVVVATPVPGAVRAAAGRQAGHVGDPGPQRRLPHPQALPTGRYWSAGVAIRVQIAEELAAPARSTYRSLTTYPTLPQRLAAGDLFGG